MQKKKKSEGTGIMRFLIIILLAVFVYLGYYFRDNIKTFHWKSFLDNIMSFQWKNAPKIEVSQEEAPKVKTMEVIRQSPVKVYYDDGALKAERNFKDGKLDGDYRTYYENGVLKEEGHYKEDKLEGILKRYSRDGKLIAEETYQDNLLINRNTF